MLKYELSLHLIFYKSAKFKNMLFYQKFWLIDEKKKITTENQQNSQVIFEIQTFHMDDIF